MCRNAAIVDSSCGPISYMMDVEVCNSVNFFSLPNGRTKDGSDGVRDDVCNSPVLHNEGMLKRHNYILRITFQSELQRVCQEDSKRSSQSLSICPICRITQGTNLKESFKNFSIGVPANNSLCGEVSLTVVSKLILNEFSIGGDHFSKGGRDLFPS